VTPTERHIKEDGETRTVKVDASTASCPWTAASAAPWITITKGRNGTGDGEVEFEVAANSSSVDRTGTLTVASQAVTITQDGHKRGEDARVEGYVRDLSGACPSLRMVVDTRLIIVTLDRTTVHTDAQTEFHDGGCNRIEHEGRVSVRGEKRPDGSVLAASISIQRGGRDGEGADVP
jgi:Putative binding domain, N-terminal/Domain of unknown function (DUF5666)